MSVRWYSWQTWLIAMHSSQKKFNFLSASNGPTSILSDISITLRKSYETIFVGIFEKPQDLAWDIFETSWRRHGIDIFFEICWRRLRDITHKTSFLRCIWVALKMSQKSSFEMFLRGLWDVSLNGDLIESFSIFIWRFIKCIESIEKSLRISV